MLENNKFVMLENNKFVMLENHRSSTTELGMNRDHKQTGLVLKNLQTGTSVTNMINQLISTSITKGHNLKGYTTNLNSWSTPAR